jgi:hypothetical protein
MLFSGRAAAGITQIVYGPGCPIAGGDGLWTEVDGIFRVNGRPVPGNPDQPPTPIPQYPSFFPFYAVDPVSTTRGFTAFTTTFIPGWENNNAAIVAIPQTSFLLQEDFGHGVATMQFHFRASFLTDALGLPDGAIEAAYTVFGHLFDDPASFAHFEMRFHFYDNGDLMTFKPLTLYYDTGDAGVPPGSDFVQPLSASRSLPAVPGGDIFTVDGTLVFAMDPAELRLGNDNSGGGAAPAASANPEPSTLVLLALGTLGLLSCGWRRRRGRRVN